MSLRRGDARTPARITAPSLSELLFYFYRFVVSFVNDQRLITLALMKIKNVLLALGFCAFPTLANSQTVFKHLPGGLAMPTSAGADDSIRYVGEGSGGRPGEDIGAQINAAYASLPASGGTIVVIGSGNGQCYRFTTPIVANIPGKYLLLEGGARGGGPQTLRTSSAACLDYDVRIGAAITLDYVPNGGAANAAVGHGIQNLTLVQDQCETPGGCGSNAIGVALGGTNGGAPGAELVGLRVIGFGTGVSAAKSDGRKGEVSFRECVISYNTTGFLKTEDDGGHVSFDGCQFQGNGTAVSSSVSVRISNSWFASNTVLGVNCSSPAACDINSDHFENAEADSTHFLAGNGVFSVLGGDMRDDAKTGKTDWWMNLAGANFLILGTFLTSGGRSADHVILNATEGTLILHNNSPNLLATLNSIPSRSGDLARLPSNGQVDAVPQPAVIKSKEANKPASLITASVATLSSSIATQFSTNNKATTNTSANFHNVLVVDGVQYRSISAAITAAHSTNARVILIPSTYLGAECPTLQDNLVFWDFRAGGRNAGRTSSFICTNNVIQYNPKTPGLTDSMFRPEMARTAVDATGSIVNGYFLTHLVNATVKGGVVDGVSTQAEIDGTLSGGLNDVQGNESVAAFNSTGGAVAVATGTIGYISTASSSTTVIRNAFGLWGRGCGGTVLGSAPTNCYGGFFSRQLGAASGRNYSAGFEGRALFEWDSNVSSGGFDLENISHVPKPFLTVDRANNVVLQAIDPAGLFLQDSTGANQLQMTKSAGIRIFTKLSPVTAGGISAGTSALPFSGLFIGNAATNNIQITGTATAARTMQLADGNQSSVLSTAFTTTAAASDSITITGATGSSHCWVMPTNSGAAGGIASVFVSAAAANQITVNHEATAGWTFNLFCTPN